MKKRCYLLVGLWTSLKRVSILAFATRRYLKLVDLTTRLQQDSDWKVPRYGLPRVIGTGGVTYLRRPNLDSCL